ncbi:MAG TPA: iron-containing alcohol dehydrogenase [Chthoniobacterales bacterium]|nr:iron-containing alcohol dehydrogenase [Chthoniobacterales bacterium]
MRFEFATAGRVLFGPDTLNEVESIFRDLGKRVLIVRGGNPERTRPLEAILGAANVEYSSFEIQGEPTIERIEEGVKQTRQAEVDFVVGLGGGSVIDAAKAIAGLVTNPGPILDYLEVIGKGKQLSAPSLPCVAIPTTAGTGTEVTRNSVLGSPEQRVKVSLRSPFLLPRFAIVDPKLTCELPPSVTASTGLDALTQLIEPYVCLRSNPITDGLCVEGMRRAARSLRHAYETGDDISAREDMALASLFGGFSLANAGLGAVHGFAAPIGGMFHAPHGAVCAALLPHVMKINVRAIRERAGNSPVLGRYDSIGAILTGSGKAVANDGIQWIGELCKALNVSGLGTYGVAEADIPVLVEKASIASSMKANPIVLTTEELTEALHLAL